MKIIKRNGAEVPFDITKIITAVTKASDSVGGKARLSREQITDIAAAVTDQCQALNRAISVEEIQDMVENQLMDIKAHDIARHYITCLLYTSIFLISHHALPLSDFIHYNNFRQKLQSADTTKTALRTLRAFRSSRRLPIFTSRFQLTILGTSELNYCVRNGNRWNLTVIVTDHMTS